MIKLLILHLLKYSFLLSVMFYPIKFLFSLSASRCSLVSCASRPSTGPGSTTKATGRLAVVLLSCKPVAVVS